MTTAQQQSATTIAPGNEASEKKRSLPWVCELMLVFVITSAVFAYHVFLSGTPHITVVFDSTGYLSVTNSCVKVFTPELFAKLGSYLAHGLPESERLAIVQYIGPARDIIRSGPTMPVILGMAHSVARSTVICAHWQIGAWSMILTLAATVCLTWQLARDAWNLPTARIAAVLSATYCGFIVSSGRVMSEIPATFAVTLCAWAFFKVSRDAAWVADGSRKSSLATSTINGVLLGGSVAFLMIARSNLVLLPLVLVAIISVLAWQSRIRAIASPVLFCTAATSFFLFLAPWILCEKVITGHPSIMIDRYGAFNLFTGLDVQNDGYDVLPSDLVPHPDRFKGTPGQALAMAAHNAAEAPAAWVDMALRKPTRLVDSPWNDYQATCFMAPWLAQIWWHQVIVLLGLFGLTQALVDGFKRKDFTKQVAPTMFAVTLAYHLVTCAFVTMRRYLFTAMPEVIILAGWAVYHTWKHNSRPQFLKFLAATVLLPAAILAVDFFCQTPHDWLPALAQNTSHGGVRWSLTIGLTAIFIWYLSYTAKQTNLRSVPWLNRAWWSATTLLSIIFIITTAHNLGAMHSNIALSDSHASKTVTFSARDISPFAQQRWLLLVDCHRQGQPAGAEPLRSLSASVNGHAVGGAFKPFFAIDQSQRENLVYESVFASCSGVELENIRQWSVLEVPNAFIENATTHRTIDVELTNGNPGSPIYLAADYYTAGRYNQEISVRRFSWSKGFSINPSGEMRMPVWTKDGADCSKATLQPGKQHLQPRAYLVLVKDSKVSPAGGKAGTALASQPTAVQPSADTTSTGQSTGSQSLSTETLTEGSNASDGFSAAIVLPNAAIGKRSHQRVFQHTITTAQLPSFVTSEAFASADANAAVRMRITGSVKAKGKHAIASIGIVETIVQAGERREELCPMAPTSIPADSEWRPFQFEDVIPLGSFAPGKKASAGKIESLRIIVAGRSWFDVLQYAMFAPQAPVEVKDLKIEFAPTRTVDLDHQAWRRVKPMPE